MVNSIFSKLKDFVGLNEQVEYEYDYDEVEGEQYQSVYPPQQQPPAAIPVADIGPLLPQQLLAAQVLLELLNQNLEWDRL